jgi:hypothetical protein
MPLKNSYGISEKTCPKKATASSVTSCCTSLLSRPVVGTFVGVT